MLKRGRKGRISNELVAASTAAILAVYAAGTWRTRDEAKRFGVEGEMRRPARPVPATAPVVAPTVVAPPVVAAVTKTPPATQVPDVASVPKPAPKPSVKIDPTPAVQKPTQTETPAPAVAAVVAASKTAPAIEPTSPTESAEAAAPAPRWLDGYYTGWGQSRHGDIQAFVRIENGRIVDAGVASCETRYPCDVIERILLQPVEFQSADVDRVSRATESADAYYNGLVMALEHAQSGTYRSPHP